MLAPAFFIPRHLKKKLSAGLVTIILLLTGYSTVYAADVLISRFDDTPDPVARGGQVNYIFEVENQQDDTADDVVLTFNLPVDTMFVSLDHPDCGHDSGTPGTVTCNFGNLLGTAALPDAGPVETVNVLLQANGNSYLAGASVTTTSADTNPDNNIVDQNTTVENGADLFVTLEGNPDPVIGGGTITYSSIVTNNNGPNDAENCTVVYVLSANTTYINGSASGSGWSCSYSSGLRELTCTRTASLAVNASTPVITFQAQVTGVSSGTVTATGTVSSDTRDPVPNNNVVTEDITVDEGTDVSVTVEATPSSVIEENNVDIIIRPRNLGPDEAATVAVTYTVPAGFTIATSSTGAGWTCDEVTQYPPDIVCTRATYAVGATDNITLTLTAPSVDESTDFNSPVVISTATAEAPGRGGNNNADTTITVTPNGVDLRISKTKSPQPVAQGSLITSRIVVHNNGPLDAAANTIVVTDLLDVGREDFDSTGGSNWSCNFDLPPNVVCDYTASLDSGRDSSVLTITTRATAAGSLGNTANVSYSGTPDDYDLTNNSTGEISVTATSAIADLIVSKSADDGVLEANDTNYEDTITYTVEVYNDGDSAASSIVMTDTFQGYINGRTSIAVTASPTSYDCSVSGARVTCTQQPGEELADGATDSFTIEVTRPITDGDQDNTAQAYSSAVGDDVRSNNFETVTVDVEPVADLVVQSKTVTPNPVQSGVEATYVITIANNGPSAAASVSVVDTFSIVPGNSGFTFISAVGSNGGNCSGLTANTAYPNAVDTGLNPALTCDWASIPSGGTRTITLKIRPNFMESPPDPRHISNLVAATTTTYDNDTGNNVIDPVILAVIEDEIDLLINNNDEPDPLPHDPGNGGDLAVNDVVYHVDYENLGPSYATGVQFTFTMTPKTGKELRFLCDEVASDDACGDSTDICTVSADSDNPVVGPATQTLTCTIGELAADATGERYLRYRVITAPDPGGDTHNTVATISANENESEMLNNAENEPTSAQAKVTLVVSKSSGGDPVELAEPFDWTVTVRNDGPSDSRNTVMSDTLPANMVLFGPAPSWTYTAGAGGTCSVSGQDLECNFGTIAFDQEVTVTIPVILVSFDSSPQQNCVTVETDDLDVNRLLNRSGDVCGSLLVLTTYFDSDFGDAPDISSGTGVGDYDTRLLNQGARHLLQGSIPYFGSCVDADGLGTLQNAAADDDDSTTAVETRLGTCTDDDDEDGVLIPVLVEGRSADLEITIGGGNCLVDGWVDFNGDGEWNESEEKVMTNTPLTVGTQTVQITVPSTINYGSSYARFRCSSAGGLTSTGTALDGEVEDYLVSLQPDYDVDWVDYGDSYDTGGGFRTILANDGASHVLGISNAPILGSCVDSDDGSLNNQAATADDGASASGFGGGNTFGTCGAPGDDEDGVVLTNVIAGQNAGLSLTVTGGTCILDGWIDFNADGDWDDGDEQVVSSQSYGVGVHALSVGIPAAAAVGNTNARFRCSSTGGLSSYGAAHDGEVEDYLVPVLGNISGQVRMDADNDGDPGDSDGPIEGVTITLYDDSGTPIATTTTDASGNYRFTGYPAGTYEVRETDPVRHQSTADIDGPNDNSISVTLDSGGSSTGNNFLDTHLARLGDYVWFDTNGDGIQQGNEPGIAGVTVNLLDADNSYAQLDTMDTDGSGKYLFDIPVGNYAVAFELPDGYIFTPANQGSGASQDQLDSDADLANGRSQDVLLIPGATDLTIDAGMLLTSGDEPASLGDFIWYDTNGDGIQDPGEPGISGVTVNLYDQSGATLLATVVTDGQGGYQFAGLAAGTYMVGVVAPTGYVISPRAQAEGRVDSDVDPGTGRTAVIGLAGGSHNADVDAGMRIPGILPAALGNFVWYDVNEDGVQNSGELGIGDVEVQLFNPLDLSSPIATTTTGSDGGYGFNGLPAGDYLVHFIVPEDMTFSPVGAGTEATDSDADPVTGNSQAVTLAAGESNPDVDSGLFLTSISPVTIGDLIWLDRDYDGIPDTGEGILGVNVVLYNAAGNAIQRVTTGVGGIYTFIGVIPGDYRVEVDTSSLPTGLTQIDDPDGVFDSGNTLTGLAVDIDTVDFGYRYNNSIGDYVWHDTDRDGIQGAEEDGIAGVTVNLLDASNALIESTTTDGSGLYQFARLPAGSYQVQFVPPNGYSFTLANQGSGPALDSFDSDADPVDGMTPVFSLAVDEVNPTLDAGLYLVSGDDPASLGDRVWFDSSQDGIQDAGESGVSGVRVNLYDALDNPVGSTVTNGQGWYGFNGLAAGTYQVEFVPPTDFILSPPDQGDDSLDSDADSVTGRSGLIVLAAGDQLTDIDAGLFTGSLPASLGDYVWYDGDRDGVQDADELGLGNVVVNLHDSADRDTPIATTISGGDGSYLFSGLDAGDYVVVFKAPQDLVFSPTGSGASFNDSNADPATGATGIISLSAGEDLTTIDAGLSATQTGPLTIGDLVWFDYNHNGLPDNGEGLADITLVLYDSDGNVLMRTTTDQDGIYGFTGVAEGDYRVEVDTSSLPDGWIPLADPDSQFDSATDLAGLSASIDTVDFGYRGPEVDINLEKTFVLIEDGDKDGRVSAGDRVTFTVTVSNQGPDTATGVVVTDHLPDGFTMQEVTVSQGGFDNGLWTVGELALSDSAAMDMTVLVNPYGDYTNIAEVTGTDQYDTDSTPDNSDPEEDDIQEVTLEAKKFPWSLFLPKRPRCPEEPDYCYLVSDRDNLGSDNSALLKYTFSSNTLELLGRLGVGDVEAIELSLDGLTLYAVNQGVLGIIDTRVGLNNSFTPIATTAIGVGNGPLGMVSLEDIDGMAFDPTTGILYATARQGDNAESVDLLLQIDHRTGQVISNAFGAGIDYLVINTSALRLFDTDDIAIDSQGVLYGVAGNSGGRGGDRLITINMQTGSVSVVGELRDGDTVTQDMEGLTFYHGNTLFGTTGIEFMDRGTSNALYRIQSSDGQSSGIIHLDQDFNGYIPMDFEAMTCPVCE